MRYGIDFVTFVTRPLSGVTLTCIAVVYNRNCTRAF